MNPYDYSGENVHFNLHLKHQTSRWLRYTVDFPPAFQTRDKDSQTVRADYFQPRSSGKAPLVILLQGVGDVSLVPCRALARSLAGKGIACFVPRLGVHSSRLSGARWRGMPHLSDEEWFEIYRTAVVEVRQAVDWASTRTELDVRRVGVLGVSFGGLVSAISMAVDERITAAVLIVSGGNSGKIVQKAKARVLNREYRTTEAEYRAGQQQYTRYLAEVAEKGFEDVVPPRQSYLNDPMTFAQYLRQRPLLMINARWDEFIPRESTLDFWEACDRPAITWLPGTHTAIWLWYPLIRRRIGGFFEAAFGL
jgi:pimeloyl-ACP methyl ester carboxylesterase